MRSESENPTLARYEDLEKVGEGGMGVVYKARDGRLDRYVALKFLAPSRLRPPQSCNRGLAEARAIAALNHPNIATIYEVDEIGGTPVLVLEFVPGGTLRSRMDAGVISLAEIVEYGLQVAEGLGYAHSHRVIHGDVKPENLLVTEDGRLKLTDFGLARFQDERTITVDGKISGTLMYLAPECLHGWPSDCRTDIFSLGVVLEEMAGGQEMPDAFRRMIARATARDRSQRYQTMEELASALRQLNKVPPTRPCDTPTVLVIEDDEGLRSVLEFGLLSEGYRVIKAGNGRDAIRLAAEQAPQMLLLDVGLPGLNGFDVCRELRRNGFAAPILMLTGRTDEVDRVVGLEIGADDYLTKPFSQRELTARIRACLRRASGGQPVLTES
jgi:CheY-like chemotaxis protein